MNKIAGMIRTILNTVVRKIIVIWFKLTGPPNVLLWGIHTNSAILRAFGATVGTNVRVVPPLTLTNIKSNGYRNLSIGDGCILGGNVYLDLTARIVMHDHVSLGPGVIVMTHNRYNENPFLEKHLASSCGTGDVVFEKWAGVKAGALIVHGVTVGEEAVVAGQAVVNRDVPSRHFVGGIPAKTIRDLNE